MANGVDMVMTSPPRAQSALVVFLVQGLIVLGLIAAFGTRLGHDSWPDSRSYVAMAEAHPDRAVQPFSARIMHPAVVRAVSWILNLPMRTSFTYVAFASLAILLAACSWLLYRSPPLPSFLPAFALFLLPWLELTFSEYTLHGIFYAALLSVYCVLLVRKGGVSALSLSVLILLFLTRESTILLSTAICAVYLATRRFRAAVLTAVVSAAGMAAALHFENIGIPNQHGVNALVYAALKVPYNLSQNVLGMKLLVDSYSYYDPVHALYVLRLPVAIGRIHHVAFYGFDTRLPLETAMAYLCSFGLLPALVAASVRGRIRPMFAGKPEAWRILMIFGALSAVTAPMLGNAVPRYLAYGWPALTLTLPLLAISPTAFTRSSFLVWHFLSAVPLALYWWTPLRETAIWPAAGTALAFTLNAAVYLRMRAEQSQENAAREAESALAARAD